MSSRLVKLQKAVADLFGLGTGLASAAIVGAAAAFVFALYFFFHMAVPSTIVLVSGPPGSSFHRNAEKYRDFLRRNHVRLSIVAIEGSFENLKKLTTPARPVDVGFVLGGQAAAVSTETLVSLGCVSHQPLMIFYRGSRQLGLLTEFNFVLKIAATAEMDEPQIAERLKQRSKKIA